MLSYHLLPAVVIDGPDSLDCTTVQFSCVVGFSGITGAMELEFFVNNTATNQPNIAEDFTESTRYSECYNVNIDIKSNNNCIITIIIMILKYNVEV